MSRTAYRKLKLFSVSGSGDTLTNIADILAQSFQTLASTGGVSIRYVRGDDVVDLTAVPGSTDYETETSGGIFESHQARDYLVLADDLKIGGDRVKPKRGDEIRETVAGEEVTFPVMALGGSRHYDFSDPHRQILRVHSKQVN